MIGDVLVSSVLCDNLRKAYPNATIDYMVYESTVAVLQGNKSISNLVLFKEEHRKSKWAFFKFLMKIRKAKYDIVIDAYAKIESFLPVIFSGAKRKISYDKKWRSLIFTDVVKKKQVPTSNLGLIIEQRLSLLSPLHLDIELETFPRLYVTPEEEHFAKALFESNGLAPSRKTVMLSIIGSSPDKTYPSEYMAAIIDYIADHYPVNMLFNYIPNQKELALEIFRLCKPETQSKIYFDLLGKNLREFIAIMHECDVIIGNDGGAINMAKALHKPSFIIFSPWIDKKGWATFEDGKNHISVHVSEYKPQLFEGKSPKEIFAENRSLYHEFDPALFMPLLEQFAKNHLD
ncbi:lipopolysaccharide heptosyltransferase family protein [Flavobacterium humi]|uniref:Lipopolysaccharide heptosyltransferase family protein n=2 Tax=Flavobacterium humi TaxID=2562683 RepID=A0A4Z0LAF8_9FLAO|nr:lipopolysaccharide heptosyltransferase family protein [Flavobacterium humi]